MGSVGGRVNPHTAIRGVVGWREVELPSFEQIGGPEDKIVLTEYTNCRRILSQPVRGKHYEAVVAGIDDVQLAGGGQSEAGKTERIVARLRQVAVRFAGQITELADRTRRDCVRRPGAFCRPLLEGIEQEKAMLIRIHHAGLSTHHKKPGRINELNLINRRHWGSSYLGWWEAHDSESGSAIIEGLRREIGLIDQHSVEARAFGHIESS